MSHVTDKTMTPEERRAEHHSQRPIFFVLPNGPIFLVACDHEPRCYPSSAGFDENTAVTIDAEGRQGLIVGEPFLMMAQEEFLTPQGVIMPLWGYGYNVQLDGGEVVKVSELQVMAYSENLGNIEGALILYDLMQATIEAIQNSGLDFERVLRNREMRRMAAHFREMKESGTLSEMIIQALNELELDPDLADPETQARIKKWKTEISNGESIH